MTQGPKDTRVVKTVKNHSLQETTSSYILVGNHEHAFKGTVESTKFIVFAF